MELNTKMIGEKEGGIGWMTFNNRARRNAMSLDMWQGVETILDEFESDDDIKVIVMRGAGDKAFVSGADISEFKERRNNAEAAAEYARISEGARAIDECQKAFDRNDSGVLPGRRYGRGHGGRHAFCDRRCAAWYSRGSAQHRLWL